MITLRRGAFRLRNSARLGINKAITLSFLGICPLRNCPSFSPRTVLGGGCHAAPRVRRTRLRQVTRTGPSPGVAGKRHLEPEFNSHGDRGTAHRRKRPSRSPVPIHACSGRGAEPVTLVRSRCQRQLKILCRSPVFPSMCSMSVSHSARSLPAGSSETEQPRQHPRSRDARSSGDSSPPQNRPHVDPAGRGEGIF